MCSSLFFFFSSLDHSLAHLPVLFVSRFPFLSCSVLFFLLASHLFLPFSLSRFWRVRTDTPPGGWCSLRAPFRGPGSAEGSPARSVGGQGGPGPLAPPCLPEFPGRGKGASDRMIAHGRCWSCRPRPCPRLDRPPAGKTRRRALPLCTPAAGRAAPPPLRREASLHAPNLRGWLPRSPPPFG